MRLLILSVLLIVAFSTFSNDTVRPHDWQPIVGSKKDKKITAFFDRANHQITKTENGDYVSGSILYSSNEDIIINIDDKKIATRSLIENYVVVCETGLALAYADYYYSEPIPTITSTPVGFMPHNTDNAETFSKKSTVYQLFCPTYI